jgi:hypothetical protein
MKTTRKLGLLAALACLAALAGQSARAADDDVPSFRKRGDNEKEQKAFVTRVGTAIVKAARTKPQKIELEKYELGNPRDRKGRTNLKIKMNYSGLITKKKYTADILIKIDSSDKDAWEVLSIDYKDSNNSPLGPSEKKIRALIPKLNR